jgi:deazaflavin-dependent oxidoreductase (nitroreductase family)
LPNTQVWNKSDWDDRNRRAIEEFRANGGKDGLVLLTTAGAKSGLPRTTPLVYTTDGDRLIVIASKGGYAYHPDWYRNLVANPEVTVEQGNERFRARAIVAEGTERQRLFDQMAAKFPFFTGYQANAPRQIPVIILERID